MDSQKKAYKIINTLRKNGFEAYIAGGAVRDIFSGHTPEDFDIVTSASYDVIQNFFEKVTPKIVGVNFKVCLLDGVEIATYRGKNSKHSGIGLKEDLSLRDLTINSMAYCPEQNKLFDFFGGLNDLNNRIIRFTGSPEERITEDPCRIIRACRFISKIDGDFAPETAKVLTELGHLTQNIPPERVRIELIKAMSYNKPSLFFCAMKKIGVLKYVSPSFDQCYGLDGGKYHGETVDLHINITGDSLSPKKPLLRLAGFYHDHGKPHSADTTNNEISFIGHEESGSIIVEKELTKLKFSNKEIFYIKSLILYHMRSISSDSSPKSVRKLLRSFKETNLNWKDWINLKIADRKANLKKENYTPSEIKGMVMAIYREINPQAHSGVFSIKELAVSGKEVMEIMQIKEGPEIGKALNTLLDFVIEDPNRNKKSILKNYLLNLIAP